MRHLLELFSGTGSIGRAFRERGWQVTSVYLEEKFHPTICCDVVELKAESVSGFGNIDLLWASPPLYALQLRPDPRQDAAGP